MKYPLGWTEEEGQLTRTFKFKDFIEAMEFVLKLVPLAEKSQHHPDIELFSFNKVKIKLITHDQNDEITHLDIDLAKKINNL